MGYEPITANRHTLQRNWHRLLTNPEKAARADHEVLLAVRPFHNALDIAKLIALRVVEIQPVDLGDSKGLCPRNCPSCLCAQKRWDGAFGATLVRGDRGSLCVWDRRRIVGPARAFLVSQSSAADPEERDDQVFMARRFWLNKESHPIKRAGNKDRKHCEQHRPEVEGSVQPAAHMAPLKMTRTHSAAGRLCPSTASTDGFGGCYERG
jgi:hypothetical protein